MEGVPALDVHGLVEYLPGWLYGHHGSLAPNHPASRIHLRVVCSILKNYAATYT